MNDTVSFGYEQVSPEEKTKRVGGVFSNVARKYDIMNDAMSGGMHRLWKDTFVRRVKPREGEDILDMAGGTGDIAFRIAKAGGPGTHVTIADIALAAPMHLHGWQQLPLDNHRHLKRWLTTAIEGLPCWQKTMIYQGFTTQKPN